MTQFFNIISGLVLKLFDEHRFVNHDTDVDSEYSTLVVLGGRNLQHYRVTLNYQPLAKSTLVVRFLQGSTGPGRQLQQKVDKLNESGRLHWEHFGGTIATTKTFHLPGQIGPAELEPVLDFIRAAMDEV